MAVAAVAAAALAPSAVAGGSTAGSRDLSPIAAGDESPEVEVHTEQEALAMDTEQFAQDLGVSAEEAYAYIERRPLIDELRDYLADKASATFSDMYIDYGPYRIVILSLGSGEDEFGLVSADARFWELLPFIEVKQVDYTEALLAKTQQQVGLLAGKSGQASDADISTGTVTVWVDSEDSAVALRKAIQDAEASGELLIPADSVNVLVGGGVVYLDSFAGNALNLRDGTAECTSGFSVEQTGGGTLEGVSTAGHCEENLELANGDDIIFQAQR